jgi:hypothetical protein
VDEPATFSLEVLRAQHGDCLLLHHGDDLVLIDGGPPGVYDATLKPRLEELVAERAEQPFVRLVMVSHIDDDHVVGLMDMFADAVDREENHLGPPIWRAGELWLNAFGALTGASATEGGADARAAAIDALEATAPGRESRAVTAGVKSGIALHQDAITLGVDRNASFGGGLVQRGEALGAVEIVPGLTLTVLSPTGGQLDELQVAWTRWEAAHTPQDATTAANLDRSVFNLSSIVVLASSGGRTMLLTGDARSDHVLEGLTAAGLLTDGGPPLLVDLVKLPHHGSVRNVDERFFDRVRARHYVISANGRDGNPEDETLRLLCDARLQDADPWTLWLTYGGVPGDGKPDLHPRLETFFAARRAGQAPDVRYAEPDGRHVITL